MALIDDHKEAALAELKRLAQPDTQPKLTDPELDAILDTVLRATVWASATVYTWGDSVIPTTRNGHRFKATTGGTSGTTEPVWPTRNMSSLDDGTVTWQEAGADFKNLYDIRAAAHKAWLMKVAKATELFDHGGDTYSQILEHCKDMAKSMEPIKFA